MIWVSFQNSGKRYVVMNKDRIGDHEHDYQADFPFSSVYSDSESQVILEFPPYADWVGNNADTKELAK